MRSPSVRSQLPRPPLRSQGPKKPRSQVFRVVRHDCGSSRRRNSASWTRSSRRCRDGGAARALGAHHFVLQAALESAFPSCRVKASRFLPELAPERRFFDRTASISCQKFALLNPVATEPDEGALLRRPRPCPPGEVGCDPHAGRERLYWGSERAAPLVYADARRLMNSSGLAFGEHQNLMSKSSARRVR